MNLIFEGAYPKVFDARATHECGAGRDVLTKSHSVCTTDHYFAAKVMPDGTLRGVKCLRDEDAALLAEADERVRLVTAAAVAQPADEDLHEACRAAAWAHRLLLWEVAARSPALTLREWREATS